MPTAVDDDLDQTTDPNVVEVTTPRSPRRRSKPKPKVADELLPRSGETTIGVVTTPGQGSEPEVVSAYFVTLNDEGHIVNDTGIPTERLLEAARTFGLPIYIKKSGQVFRGRLESSGHSVTVLDKFIPTNDLTRAFHLPAGEQLRLISQHLDNMEAVEHLTAIPAGAEPSPGANQSRPAAVSPTFRTYFGPSEVPSSFSASPHPIPTGSVFSAPTAPNIEIGNIETTSSTPIQMPSIVIPISEPAGGETGTVRVEVPSATPPTPAGVQFEESEAPTGPSAVPISPSSTANVTPPPPPSAPPSPPTSSIPASAEEVSPTTQPEAFASPTGLSLPDTPGTIQSGDQAGQLSESNRKREPTGRPAAPIETSDADTSQGSQAEPSAAPAFGRRPGRDRRRQRPPLPSSAPITPSSVAPAVTPSASEAFTPSPAIAPGAPLSASTPVTTSAGQATLPADSIRPAPAAAESSREEKSTAGRPPTQPSDHQAARRASPMVTPPTGGETGEPAVDEQEASPAFIAGGQPAVPVVPPEPAPSTGDEQIGAAPTNPSATPPPPAIRDSGPLQGVNDPGTLAYQPLSTPAPVTAEQPTARGEVSPATETPEVANQEQQQATVGQLRASKVEAQRRAQWESSDRVRQWKAIQQGQKAKNIGVQFESAAEETAKLYKRGWQIAQEVAEDTALSMSDWFLFSGPVVVGLYILRWVGGNMMGRLFTFQFSGIELERIPAYSLSDPIDYVRHMKFLIVAAWTGAVYGLIFFVLWLVMNPQEALKLGLKLLTDMFPF